MPSKLTRLWTRDVGSAPTTPGCASRAIHRQPHAGHHRWLPPGRVRPRFGRERRFSATTRIGPVNDGRAALAVLGVNDDIAFEAVGCSCQMVHVRCFGEGDDGLAGQSWTMRSPASMRPRSRRLVVNHRPDSTTTRGGMEPVTTWRRPSTRSWLRQAQSQGRANAAGRGRTWVALGLTTSRLSRKAFHCSRWPAPKASAASTPSALRRRNSAVTNFDFLEEGHIAAETGIPGRRRETR